MVKVKKLNYTGPEGERYLVRAQLMGADEELIVTQRKGTFYGPNATGRYGTKVDEEFLEVFWRELTDLVQNEIFAGNNSVDLLDLARNYLGITYSPQGNSLTLNDYLSSMTSGLQRLAYEAITDENVEREALALIERYLDGNDRPGIDNGSLGNGVYYFRGKRGARVFYRNGDSGFEVLAIASKKGNIEDRVISEVTRLYCSN